MIDKVRCHVHGEQEETYICCHIMGSLDDGRAVGFHRPKDSPLERPDAWCTECERVRVAAGGEWTDDAMAFVQVKLVCGACYDLAKSIWLQALQADAATKH